MGKGDGLEAPVTRYNRFRRRKGRGVVPETVSKAVKNQWS